MEDESMKPCPFCGGEARWSHPTCRPETPYNPSDRMYPSVSCKECYASVPGKNEDYRGFTAITAWNTRATPIAEQVKS
jgi:Lar family restriction alleviation protein